MSQYLLSTYAVEGGVSGAPGTPEEMQEFMGRVIALEAEMDAAGVFVFGGALQGPDAASVLTPGDAGAISDSPFVESTAHIAGFYIINADDLDAALAWGEPDEEHAGRLITSRHARVEPPVGALLPRGAVIGGCLPLGSDRSHRLRRRSSDGRMPGVASRAS